MFKEILGLQRTTVRYARMEELNRKYLRQVCRGDTGHRETSHI